MTIETNSVVAQKLKILQTKFHEQLPARVIELMDNWQHFLSENDLSFLKQCQHIAHSLAGSALTFDAVVVGNLAREFELAAQKFVESDLFPHESQCQSLQQQLDVLESESLSWDPDGVQIGDCLDAGVNKMDKTPADLKSEADVLLVYLLEGDELLAQKIKNEFSKNNLDVETFNSAVELGDVCRDRLPGFIVVDVMSAEKETESIKVFEQLHEDCILLPPIIFLSQRDDIQARLAALRVGVVRYIDKPVEISGLIDDIKVVTHRSDEMPYRVLLVDDDKLLAEHNSSVLQNAGMMTMSINDPMQVLDSLNSFKPDLILLDYNLPGCTGLEVAGVIRQDGRRMKTEIVFLSSELDLGNQIAASDIYGEDFLTKPVAADVLVNHLRVRLKRARWASKLDDKIRVSSKDSQSLTAMVEKTEFDLLKQDLEQAKQDIVKANKSKSEFLSRMNHELRTPMNSIIGFGQLLEMEQDQTLTPIQLDNIREITKAGRRLLELVNKVLDRRNRFVIGSGMSK